MNPRPGQVYWNQRLCFSVVVYSVTAGEIRVVVMKPYGFGRRTIYSTTWKKGVPAHYGLQYDPPERSNKQEQCESHKKA